MSFSLRKGCIPVPRSMAPCFCTILFSVEMAFCMVSSNWAGDLKGELAFISITCSCISFPKVKLGNFMKLTIFPQ